MPVLVKFDIRSLAKFFIVVAMLFMFPSSFASADAGVPAIISYQGRLTDSSGNLLGGSGTTYYFKFSIWDSSDISSGTRLWPAPATTLLSHALTVRQGVFNENIGDTVAGYPHTLDYDFSTNKDVYLQVEASSDNITFETLSPRRRISSAVFAQVAGAVSGVGPSSFGTTTPFANSVITVQATSTSAIPVLIRAFVGQVADLFRIEDSSFNHLFSINSSGGIFASSTLSVTGITNLYSRLKILDVSSNPSNPQLQLSQSATNHGEFYVDAAGDLHASSTGRNIRQNDENLWVCKDGSCGVEGTPPAENGNVIVETGIMFGNKFRFKQIDASTTVMYDTVDNPILEFDEGQ